MNDIHNYLAFARFGFVGIALTGLGLIGCLVHRRTHRFAISFAVTMAGCLLLFDAAARFHKTTASPLISASLVGIAAASVLLSHRRHVPPQSPGDSTTP